MTPWSSCAQRLQRRRPWPDRRGARAARQRPEGGIAHPCDARLAGRTPVHVLLACNARPRRQRLRSRRWMPAGWRKTRTFSVATGFERELYLTAISYQARALMATQDSAAIIALCEPVIPHDLEGERLQVSNSPYQQSAFLATRTRLYEAVATAITPDSSICCWNHRVAEGALRPAQPPCPGHATGRNRCRCRAAPRMRTAGAAPALGSGTQPA